MTTTAVLFLIRTCRCTSATHTLPTGRPSSLAAADMRFALKRRNALVKKKTFDHTPPLFTIGWSLFSQPDNNAEQLRTHRIRQMKANLFFKINPYFYWNLRWTFFWNPNILFTFQMLRSTRREKLSSGHNWSMKFDNNKLPINNIIVYSWSKRFRLAFSFS